MKNKETRVSLVLIGLMAWSLLVIATLPVYAQPPPPPANVSIGNIILPQGATATIPIMITEASENVSGAVINLTYDPTVVQVTAVVGKPPWDLFLCNDTIEGERRMIGGQLWSPALTAPTKFADVTIKAIGNPGDYTPLNLEVSDISWGTGSPYDEKNVSNGSVSIIGARVPEYNIFGLSALIGLLAIILAVKVKRRR